MRHTFHMLRVSMGVGSAHRWIPRLVASFLAALILLQVVHTAAFLRPISVGSTTQSSVAGSGKPVVDAEQIVAAHLFGAVPLSANDDGAVVASNLNMLLKGTIATFDPHQGIAIISSPDASMYRVGQSVGETTLHAVYSDHVVLDHGGVLETLMMPELMLDAPRMANSPAISTTKRGLLSILRTEANMDATSEVHGFSIHPARNLGAFVSAGLKDGDLLTSVDGKPLNDLKRGSEILGSVSSRAQVMLGIERAGQTEYIAVNVADLGRPAEPAVLPPSGNASIPMTPWDRAAANATADAAGRQRTPPWELSQSNNSP